MERKALKIKLFLKIIMPLDLRVVIRENILNFSFRPCFHKILFLKSHTMYIFNNF